MIEAERLEISFQILDIFEKYHDLRPGIDEPHEVWIEKMDICLGYLKEIERLQHLSFISLQEKQPEQQ